MHSDIAWIYYVAGEGAEAQGKEMSGYNGSNWGEGVDGVVALSDFYFMFAFFCLNNTFWDSVRRF